MKERCPVCHMTGQHKLQCPNRDGFQPKFSARRVERGPKVLFLDFDGVINSTAFHETREKQKPNFEPAKLSMEWWAEGIDPDAVGRLNGLLKRTGAKVVVSSSWRLGTDRAWLQRVLEMRGFEGDVIGITERYTGMIGASRFGAGWRPRGSRALPFSMTIGMLESWAISSRQTRRSG